MNGNDLLTAVELKEALGLRGGRLGLLIAGRILKALEIDKANAVNGKLSGLKGAEFSARTLEEVGVRYDVPQEQLSRIPAEGGFITVSNHHFGALDGLILSAMVGAVRPDYKILTTFLLTRIPGLRDSFLPVDNFKSGGLRSISGLRKALSHISEGGPLGLFPSGEVATYQRGRRRTALKKHIVEDIPWADNIIKMISRSGLPVIPIFFEGTNSRSFHLLGRIHPRLRTLRLVHEVFNKKGSVIKVRIGEPIKPEEMAQYDVPSLGKYLRNRCYALEAECRPWVVPAPSEDTEPVAEQEPLPLILEELDRISDRIVYEMGDYRCYFTRPDDIPHLMRELGRIREVSFRLEGEGTGKALDLDEYDYNYKHLILWHKADREMVGAYRMGIGSELIPKRGVDAFYTASLFKYEKGAEDVLSETLELGRAVVAPKYQKEVLSLKLLLSGLAVAAWKHPEIKYCIGPVSISNSCPDFYKSLIIRFLERTAPYKGQPLAHPGTPFTPDYLSVDPDALLSKYYAGGVDEVDKLDRLIATISDEKYRMPVLVRKYFKCSAKIICFNVDVNFFNSLDGLILLDINEFPLATLRSLIRFMPEADQESILARFSEGRSERVLS